MDRFPILMYHRIVSEKCPIPDDDGEESRYAVELEKFEWQLRYIAESGGPAVSMRMVHSRLASGERIPSNWVVFTFDDGNLSDFVHARPLLADGGYSATFFVGGERVGASGGLEPMMLEQMARDGFDIGSHGMTHRFLSGLSAAEEEGELRRSKEFLERVSGSSVAYYSPPGGRIGRRGLAAAKRLSYGAVCTSVFGLNRCSGNRFEFRRIPVMGSTTRERFRDFVEGGALRLLPLFVRYRTLRLARRVLGEAGYRRLRAAGLGS
ncbi:MAG: polysaccharide deacetylase family protein [Candidatus Krumholzibacteria bacterium]|nr:polysaccharide deacetylase family protein [Candidatus Krumholzibacteria bacterium]